MTTPRPPGGGWGASLPEIDAIQAKIFTLVLRNGPLSRSALAERIGVDPSTVTRSLPTLIDLGWLRETTARRGPRGRGRPSLLVRVHEGHHLAVGVKIGPTGISGVATDLLATPIARRQRDLDSREPRAVLDAVSSMVLDLVQSAFTGGIERSATVVGVGIGVGGHIEHDGLVRNSHIMGWHDVDVASPVAERTGVPVVVNNDANTLAVAHHWYGAARSVENLATVTLGRGIGCGLILAGRLHQGADGSAGELGHIPVDPHGPVCACGNTGCLESLASDLAILAAINRNRPGAALTDIDEAADLARTGDSEALAAFREAGTALGRGIAVINNLLNLEQVVVAGEMVTAIDLLEPTMRDAMDRYAFSTTGERCRLFIDCDNDDLWERGAACLAVRAAILRPHHTSSSIRTAGL